MNEKSDIGLIGLAVMGQNLALNINDKGYGISVFNRTKDKTDTFIREAAKGRTNVQGLYTIEGFTASIKTPRKIILMVKAGEVVDQFIETLIPFLQPGDTIIDGGNSNFHDTIRRTKYLQSKNILFVGTGVSGGEEGARRGPSIMPGGNPDAWPLIKPIFQAISAKTPEGDACCDWVGEDGAGHFVKMVHNGIEYGDMQLICEAYHIMKDIVKLSYERMQEVFAEWNQGELDSYLIEITADILKVKDSDGSPLVEKIMDTAGQKGTGRWTAITALEQGVPLTLICEAVFARSLSAMKKERVQAASLFSAPATTFTGNTEQFILDIRKALFASKVISYTQGFMLMREAAKEYKWNLNYGGIALMWRGGCIIRSAFLGNIKKAFDKAPALSSLIMDDYFKKVILETQEGWRNVVATAVRHGIPVPAFSAALSFFDGYRSGQLPANLLQAQRDYFGAHTYERIDKPEGEFFHTNWTGSGGQVVSGTYNG